MTAQESQTATGADLAALRQAAGLTTREAAAKIGRSHVRITQIEKDGINDVDVIELLATAYGVTFEAVRAANRVTKNCSSFITKSA